MRKVGAISVDVLREMVTPVLLQIWAIATIIAAVSGPFGSYAALPFGERLIYWGAVSGAAICLALGLRVLWRLVLRRSAGWIEDVLVVMSFSAVLGPVVAAWSNRAWTSEVTPVNWMVVSGVAALIALSSILLRQIFAPRPAPAVVRRDRLLARLDVDGQARIAHVSSDNHHIRVALSDGTEHRLLMRLRDAVAEVDVEPGNCVHRSHWVATQAIVGVVREKGRDHVELEGGALVPVGPKYRVNLVQDGFLTA